MTLSDRETIGLRRAGGATITAIAAELGVHKSTISRELRQRPGVRGEYRPLAAHQDAEARAREHNKNTPKLWAQGRLRDYVEAGLRRRWSPQEISQRLRHDHPDDPVMRVSAETIYRSLFVQARGSLKQELTQYLRSQRPRRRPRTGRDPVTGATGHGGSGRGRLSGTISIRERPAEAEDRAVPGHWEGDLILGANNASAIGTLVERSTRFVMLIHLPGRRTAEEFYQALMPTITALPEQLRRSLTWDNGKEMGCHHKITLATGMPIYFADPHSPWQRGSNENTNGLLRQYYPKGTSLRPFGPDHLEATARELNGRPRKTLGWRTPAEALNDILGKPYETTVLR